MRWRRDGLRLKMSLVDGQQVMVWDKIIARS